MNWAHSIVNFTLESKIACNRGVGKYMMLFIDDNGRLPCRSMSSWWCDVACLKRRCHHRLPPMIASMRRNLISRRHWLPPTLSNALGARVQPDFGPRSKHNPAVKQDTMLFYRVLNDGAIELKRGREKKNQDEHLGRCCVWSGLFTLDLPTVSRRATRLSMARRRIMLPKSGRQFEHRGMRC